MDNRQLETVAKFADFLSFLENPKEFKKMIEDAVAANKEMKALLGAKATVESAEAFAKKADAEIGQRYVELESAQKRSDEAFSKKESDLKAREAAVEAAQAKFAEDEAKLKADIRKSQDLADEVVKREGALVKREAAIGAKEQELADLELSLKAKAEQIKTLLGA